jgi:hypothetical protein
MTRNSSGVAKRSAPHVAAVSPSRGEIHNLPADSGEHSLPVLPTLFSRVRKYTLLMGGVCAVAGAVEGAIVGSILSPGKAADPFIMTVALDRFLLLGLLGAGFGAVVGALDWYVRSQKKGREKSPPVRP